ncbi:MAG: enoyl-CoA hydratase, partial [Thalassospira sp.]|nr:enoyl-CoA hydratase [Thalassospira sp.]
MSEQTGLNVTLDDRVATISICQPERKNALTKPMWGELAKIVQSLSDDLELR